MKQRINRDRDQTRPPKKLGGTLLYIQAEFESKQQALRCDTREGRSVTVSLTDKGGKQMNVCLRKQTAEGSGADLGKMSHTEF